MDAPKAPLRRPRLRPWAGGAALLLLLAAGCGQPASSRPDAGHLAALRAGPDVRVRVFLPFTFTRLVFDLSDGALELVDETGRVLPRPPDARQAYVSLAGDQVAVAFKPGAAAQAKAERCQRVWVRSADQRLVFVKLSVPELGLRRHYEGGAVDVWARNGRLAVVNQLPLELYVARVLPAEMDPDHFTAEALKSQAVVARTWALQNLGRHRRAGYDFCDYTHCQVYKGRRLVSQRAEHAVCATLGQVLTFAGRPAEAFYHSTCGGNTVSIEDAWPVPPLRYLTRVEDVWQPGLRPYCDHSPYARWVIWTSLRRLQRGLQHEGALGAQDVLKDLKVDFINRSGRVQRLLAVTDHGSRYVDEEAFRRLINGEFGRNKVLSKFFEVRVQGQQVAVAGRGLGHGVGLCQWGARGMALHGFTYNLILEHYFPGTELAPGYGQTGTGTVTRGPVTQNSQASAQ